MIPALDLVQEAGAGIAVVDRPEGLTAFVKPGIAAAIWQRDPAPDFQAWIDTLPEDRLPSARVILRPGAVREAMVALCDGAGLPQGLQRNRLADDVAALAHVFARLMGAPFLRLRFDRVTGNACRRFHVDRVTARLVCTYRGPGTQYGSGAEGAEPDPVFSVPTGAPIILRGTLWRDDDAPGLLHRSPPIEGTGLVRSVLVIDPIHDPGEEA